MRDLEFVTRVFKYLDTLRESGDTNMFGAGPYVEEVFGLKKKEAKNLTVGWMQTFSKKEPKERAKEFIKEEQN